jgi:hypothetical protein
MKIVRTAQRALALLGIDPAVGFVLLGNAWVGVFAIVQLALIVRYLSAVEQGVNFNFAAFFQFQVFFDLGLGLAVQQLASHQRAFLHETAAGLLDGDKSHVYRLGAIFRLTARWYLGMGVLLPAVLTPIGWLFFRGEPKLESVDWQWPWLLTMVGTAGCLAAAGFSKFLSGCGDITAVARVNTLQLMLTSLGFCATLALGGRLLAFPVSVLCGLAVPFVWVTFVRRSLLADLFRSPRAEKPLSWRREVMPFQWKLAVFLLSAQVFQLMNPVALARFGPEVAGQLGLNLTICVALQLLGIMWIDTRVPVFGNLIAKRQWAELDHVYRDLLWKSTGFLAAILSVWIAGHALLFSSGISEIDPWLSRFLPPVPGAVLALAVLANHLFYVRAAYLRAHCREPYLGVALVQGLALAATILLAGRFGTVESMLLGYLACSVVIGLGWGGCIFSRKRREWHAADAK